MLDNRTMENKAKLYWEIKFMEIFGTTIYLIVSMKQAFVTSSKNNINKIMLNISFRLTALISVFADRNWNWHNTQIKR